MACKKELVLTVLQQLLCWKKKKVSVIPGCDKQKILVVLIATMIVIVTLTVII